MKSILVVEDDEDLRSFIAELLGGELSKEGLNKDYVIVVAENGMTALAMIDNGLMAEVVISDVGMAVMNGLLLLEEIRLRGLEMPFLFHSASINEEVLGIAELHSAFCFHKPDDTFRMCDKVISLLEKPIPTTCSN